VQQAVQQEDHAVYRFGRFRFDPVDLRLRNGTTKVELRPQAGRLLRLLLERHGEFVSRADIKACLWANGSSPKMDVGQQINTCVRLVRTALNDHAKRPVYIETGKSGYCFIAPISACGEHEKESSPETDLNVVNVATLNVVNVATVDEPVDLSSSPPNPAWTKPSQSR
jgi:DNA-binding winged helix-turn-helix (wHTH) protein